MSRDNPTWGRRRICSELHLLGYEVAELTVAKYMFRGRTPPSQGWRVFLKNHSREIAAIDFFTIPTATFRVLYCFVVIRHDSRRVVHFNVTEHPTAVWTGQQIATPFRMTKLHAFFSVTMMVSTATSFPVASRA